MYKRCPHCGKNQLYTYQQWTPRQILTICECVNPRCAGYKVTLEVNAYHALTKKDLERYNKPQGNKS